MNQTYQKIEKRSVRQQRILSGVTYGFLTLWGLMVLFPFYWMLLTSIKSYGSYASEYIPKFYPTNPTFDNYI